MKTRQGFVSNSSSTSFCIAGGRFDLDDITKNIQTSLGMEELVGEFNKRNKLRLECYYTTDYDSAYIGLDINEMKDDETKSQFLKRVSDIMYSLIGYEVKVSIIHEAWEY